MDEKDVDRIADAIESRAVKRDQQGSTRRMVVATLQILVAPAAITISTVVLQNSSARDLEAIKSRLALSQAFYEVQIAKLYDGFRHASATDRVVHSASAASTPKRIEELATAIQSFASWVEENEFYLDSQLYRSASGCVTAGFAYLQSVQMHDHASIADRRSLWSKAVKRFRRLLAREARRPTFGTREEE